MLVTGSGTSWTATEAPLPENASADPVIGTLGSVACPSASSCVAAGTYDDSSSLEGLLVTGLGTSWTATEAPLPENASASPNAALNSVACPSASSCVADGTYEDSSGVEQGLLVTGWVRRGRQPRYRCPQTPPPIPSTPWVRWCARRRPPASWPVLTKTPRESSRGCS